MDDSSNMQSDSLPLSFLATSVLGISSPLRLRPHGSTQKPHIILRRVTVSGASSGDGEASNIVRFSFFAAKRIEVKPGKEILLTVASPDGYLEDQPVVFEADIAASREISDEKSDTQVAEEEDVYLPPAGEAIPPKMRRAWTKKVEEVSSALQELAVTHSSVGVQAEPAYVSVSTQVQPACTPVSVQTHANYVSTSTQVDPKPRPLPSAAQTDDRRRYMTLDVQSDASNPWDNLSPITRRSLSPMDLGNTPYSQGCQSPQYWSPPGRDGLDSPEYSPTHNNPGDSPAWDSGSPSYSRSRIGTPSQRSTPEKHHVLRDSQDAPMASDWVHPPSSVPLAFTPATAKHPTNPNTSGKIQHPNHFVSAGVLVNFDEIPAAHQVGTNGKHAEVVTGTTSTWTSQLKTSSVSGPVSPVLSASTSTRPLSPPSSLSQGYGTVSSNSPNTSNNAVASSSKVVLNRVLPLSRPSPQQSALHNGPRTVAGLSSRALEKSPASQTQVTGKRSSPPPNPKAIAYISSGPSSNPLNIKPSLCAMPRVATSTPPTAPRTLSQTSKKRVVVGAGWPFVKATNAVAHGVNPPIPAQPPPPLPPSGYRPTVKTTNASSSNSCSSPLPSPLMPTITSAASKWKRVAGPPPAATATTDSSRISQPLPMVVDGQQKSNKPVAALQTGPLLALSSPNRTVPLKDRIRPAAAPPQSRSVPTEKSAKTTINGRERNLLSRISDFPSQLPMASTEDRLKKVEPSPSSNATPTSQPSPQASAVTLFSSVAVPQPLVHPLPPKPVLAINSTTPRSAKRDRPTTPDADHSRRRRRNLKWPTVDCNHSIGLKGDGELAIRNISFSSDGLHFALSLSDRSIRIWNNRDRAEIAKLMHNCPLVSVLWMDGDSGIISLGEDGLVSKWTRTGNNCWQWAKVLDAGNDHRQDDDQICFAYNRHRIAVSFPRTGVKVWICVKGTWQQQRAILRQNVSSLRFVEDGDALLGGTRDGVLWYCEVPNGTLRAYAFLKAKITALDLNPAGTHVLVSQAGGSARLLSIRQTDNKGSVEHSYTCKEIEARPNGGFGAVFATQGQAVLFGSVEGCVLVWDKDKSAIVYGLAHEEGDIIQAVASFNGALNREGCLLTGTNRGNLAWWSEPVAAGSGESNNHKRARIAK